MNKNRSESRLIFKLKIGRVMPWLFLAMFFLVGQSFAQTEQVGLMPVPVFKDVKLQSTVRFEPASGLYTYEYAITNPPTNTGEIWLFKIEITMPPDGQPLGSEGLTIPGGVLTRTFDEKLSALSSVDPDPMVPIGQRAPSGWHGGIGVAGVGMWSIDNFTPKILPGQTLPGFEVVSQGLPTIRQSLVEPDWILVVESEDDVDEELLRRADEIKQKINLLTKTLGPTAPPAIFDVFAFITTIRGYITESQTLNWLTDPDLAAALNNHLDATVANINTGDIAAAKTTLQEFIAALPAPPAGTPACTSECSGLLVFNAQYLLDQLATKPDLRVTKLTLTQITR